MSIATWNVHTLYRAGRMNELMKEVDKYIIDMCVIIKLYIGLQVKKKYPLFLPDDNET